MTKLSSYDADTLSGAVFSEHAPYLDEIQFNKLDSRDFNEQARRIRDIEKAAYEQGQLDMAARVRAVLVVHCQ